MCSLVLRINYGFVVRRLILWSMLGKSFAGWAGLSRWSTALQPGNQEETSDPAVISSWAVKLSGAEVHRVTQVVASLLKTLPSTPQSAPVRWNSITQKPYKNCLEWWCSTCRNVLCLVEAGVPKMCICGFSEPGPWPSPCNCRQTWTIYKYMIYVFITVK